MAKQTIKKQILDVIRLYGGRVTPADIVAHAGLTEPESIKELNQLALNTESRLEVKTTGDILYCFPDIAWYQIDLLRRAINRKVMLISLLGYYMVIGVFRFMLILSPILTVPAAVTLIFLFMLLVIEKVSGATWVHMAGILLVIALGVKFLFRCPDDIINRGVSSLRVFLSDCQSFVVGIPRNKLAFEADIWQKMAEFIRYNGGVATSEQLSQFTGTNVQDGSKVFPILVHFDGRPEVTASGNIVYVFPSLLVSADATIKSNFLSCPEEPYWRLTNISKASALLVVIYATINFIAYMALLIILNPSPHFHWLTIVVYSCLIFSIFFFVYPICRASAIALLNLPISWRNAHRHRIIELLEDPPIELNYKLEEAQKYQKEVTDVSHEKTIYRTDVDMLGQQFENLDKDLA